MMITRAFNDMRELTAFVNENGIAKEDIVNMFPTNDGLYILAYYA